jgi:hypothetical protein
MVNFLIDNKKKATVIIQRLFLAVNQKINHFLINE